jgi:hypothetical protein
LDICPRTGVVTADLRTIAFPNDEALLKLYYLRLRNIDKKWTLNRCTILFDELCSSIKRLPDDTKSRTPSDHVSGA